MFIIVENIRFRKPNDHLERVATPKTPGEYIILNRKTKKIYKPSGEKIEENLIKKLKKENFV